MSWGDLLLIVIIAFILYYSIKGSPCRMNEGFDINCHDYNSQTQYGNGKYYYVSSNTYCYGDTYPTCAMTSPGVVADCQFYLCSLPPFCDGKGNTINY